MAKGIASAFFDLLTRGRLIEYLMRRKPGMKTYKYTVVPSGVDRNLETLRAAVARGVNGCAFNATPCTLGDAGCVSVTCPNCICDRTHRNLLIEYLNKVEAEKENIMEERLKAILKPGMIIRTVHGDFRLWIGGSRGEMYSISLRAVEREFDTVVLDSILTDSFSPEEINAVFADAAFDAPAVRPCAIVALLKGEDTQEKQVKFDV
jgi:hypothetical protein